MLLLLLHTGTAPAQLYGPLRAIRTTPDWVQDHEAVDMDQDGDLDLVSVISNTNKIVWWENVDVGGPGSGDGSSWQVHYIETEIARPYDIDVGDVDLDGDLDLVVTAAYQGRLAWYENVQGDASEWSLGVLDDTLANPRGVRLGDIDQDGDLDVLCTDWSSFGEIYWYENDDQAGTGTGNGTSWTRHDLDLAFETNDSELVDVDGDGDLDFVAGTFWSGGVAWWENDDIAGPGTGDGSSWTRATIDASLTRVSISGVSDMDGDGDLDLLAAVGDYSGALDSVLWFENVDVAGPGTGDGSAWQQQTVATSVGDPLVAIPFDMDGDGDQDIAVGTRGADLVKVYENVDLAGPGSGDGSSWTEAVIAALDGPWDLVAADLDADGDLDLTVTSSPADRFLHLENADIAGAGTGDGSTWVETEIAVPMTTIGGAVADLDGDGDLDVVAPDPVGTPARWYANSAGGAVWTPFDLPSPGAPVRLVVAGDLDSDGDVDLVGSTYLNGLVWWENDDIAGPGTGDGTSWTTWTLDAAYPYPQDIAIEDVDGDGDLDIAVAAYATYALAWFDNVDTGGPGTGDASSWTLRAIDSTSAGTNRIHFDDIDGDGDLDVAVAAADDVLWMENEDVLGPGSGNATLWTSRPIATTYSLEDVDVADVDGDGDLDVVGVGLFLEWFSNDDVGGPGSGDGLSWTVVGVAVSFGASREVQAVDLDGDGDTDFLSQGGSRVTRWDNDDLSGPGTGDGSSFTSTDELSLGNTQFGLPADLDGDTDYDIVAWSPQTGDVVWLQNLNGPPIADAGPPGAGSYVGMEGSPVAVDGSDSSDTGAIVDWSWDCDDDGVYEISSSVATGVSCTFLDDGVFSIWLRVTDDLGATATASATVSVSNVAPAITTTPSLLATETVEWTYSPSASDPGIADVLSWSLGVAPTGMSVDAGSGLLSWTPTWDDIGTWPVTLLVDDDGGGQDSQTFDLQVAFADVDGDGLPDTWEVEFGLDPTVDDASDDGDEDGLDNLAEWLGSTDPNVYDGPPVPQPIEPVAGDETAPLPTLVWTPVTDPNGDEVTYDVEVWLDDALSSQHAFVSSLGSANWSVEAALPDNADAFWRVRAADPYVASDWSDLTPFFVNSANDAPTAPVLLAPLDVELDAGPPILRWSDAEDVDRDMLDYRVSLEGPGVGTVEELVSSATEWTVPTPLTEGATYTWWVTAIDEHGAEGPPSEAGSFSMSAPAPTPEPIDPDEGCGCAASGGDSSSGWLVLFGVLALRRRRRPLLGRTARQSRPS